MLARTDNLTENEIQRAVFAHLRTRGATGIVAFHPKNGGVHQRGRRAGINSGLGVLAGIPDVIVIKRVRGPLGGPYYGQCYALELKRPKGKVSEQQEYAAACLQNAGAICGVAYGLDDALAWLQSHGLLRGEIA